MPGTIVFKPVEANLTHNIELKDKINPYCSFLVGGQKFSGHTCEEGGKYPHWNGTISVPVTTDESNVLVQVTDKDNDTRDDNIGSCNIDLNEIERKGQISRWYPLYHNNKKAGEILLEVAYQSDSQPVIQGQEQLSSNIEGVEEERLISHQEKGVDSTMEIDEEVCSHEEKAKKVGDEDSTFKI